MASRAERVESELVSLADWIERYFASRDLLPPPAIAAGVASARAALALPADDAACCDVPGVNILDGRCANCGGEMRQGHPNPTPRAEAAPSS